MKKMKFATLFTAAFLAVNALRMGYRKIFHRSIRSAAVEDYLKLMSHKDAYSNPEAFERYKYEQAIENRKKYKLSRYLMSYAEESVFAKSQLFTLKASAHAKVRILYLHSGGFMSHISYYEWNFIDHLCKELDAEVYVPMYPLIPSATHEEAYELIEKLYNHLGHDLPITVMGVGAGGALACGFCESLNEDQSQPDHLVLISPWLDLTMSHDHKQFEKKDPMLSAYGIGQIGNLWAGSKSVYAPKVSPFYGDVSNLSDVLMIAGTHELLYPDILRFYHKLRSHHINTKLITGDHMIHNYPILPIPEAKEALRQIISFIAS